MNRSVFMTGTAALFAAGLLAATPSIATAGDDAGSPGAGSVAARTAAGSAHGSDYSIQGTCGDDYDIDVGPPSGIRARAGGSLWCSKGKIHFDGWVKDVRADGKCAQVYGNVGNKSFSTSVCGKGDKKETHPAGKGSTAHIYLRTFKSGS
ncbi:hypothetical protein MMF93_30380 [Streptomyces tubbatahanensis]|uniref:Secreted protein n=1 Tax=Streptomyces tubbatahanensis TaxID=2923272 RepID=A0ABY3Y0E6_9ACTN|nr:hypothetical protein [Streptomyces tubbatahanensis]UNT00292.1 hypothetical protein MMF93_30380 [Streptomyces tubbatahanensis]